MAKRSTTPKLTRAQVAKLAAAAGLEVCERTGEVMHRMTSDTEPMSSLWGEIAGCSLMLEAMRAIKLNAALNLDPAASLTNILDDAYQVSNSTQKDALGKDQSGAAIGVIWCIAELAALAIVEHGDKAKAIINDGIKTVLDLIEDDHEYMRKKVMPKQTAFASPA